MKGTKGHRDRKNGASREQWEARKAARNVERAAQEVYIKTGSRARSLREKSGWE